MNEIVAGPRNNFLSISENIARRIDIFGVSVDVEVSARLHYNARSRLYKPVARKPWLTVYRAHAGSSHLGGELAEVWESEKSAREVGYFRFSLDPSVGF